MQFHYQNPTHILFGQGQIANINRIISPNQKVLLLFGGGSIKRNGIYQQVEQALTGYSWLEFGGVEPNPTKQTLDNAIALARSEQVDFILAVGGGSVIDGAKYVAAGACFEGDGWDIVTGKHKVSDALSLGVVLTLPATGSESNCGAVISNTDTQDKLSFRSPYVQPVFAVLDPDVMKSLPTHQLINGMVDAWVHVCEQYLTWPQGAMVQDGYAEALLKTLLQLGGSFNNRDSDEWRANLMFTANQALNGLIGSGVAHDWATHALGHQLTALYGTDHGRTLAIIQPALLRHQLDFKRAKLEQLGRNVFGLEASGELAGRTIDAIEDFFQSLGVATVLTQEERNGQDKSQAVDALVTQLQKNAMDALGENHSIDLEASREIFNAALQ
ncbi:iron-containing alcohol dehydrogenase [Shewanella sp. GXUN23E]|uniref:iron-containing alcohol dehydrogenase n=1 Tax=Shewanella sp. GXUN23E TaxID=3422498 RepID=UPI003D7C8813